MPLLDIKHLSVDFRTRGGLFRAVDDISLSVEIGDVLSIVGESGSGKSVAMLAVMGLLPPTAVVSAERLVFEGTDLLTVSPRARRRVIGKDLTMIFQEPMTSLNPCFTVGFQLGEAIRRKGGLSRAQQRDRAVELMSDVGIPEPERRLAAFPHQLSGGMSQRVMIAMALAGEPKLLIADEPTTALDVTIQAQILELLRTIQRDREMALVLITHDMGVVAETAERVIVQYAGQQVEQQPTLGLFRDPHHPYTAALLSALPERSAEKLLPSIPGMVPGQFDKPAGCVFSPRCAFAQDRCFTVKPPPLPAALGRARCLYPLLDGASVPVEEIPGADLAEVAHA